METLSGDVLYLYGLVSCPPPPQAVQKFDAADARVVAHDDVGCIVGVVRASDYEMPQGASAAAQLEWIAPRAWRHHEVLRELHAEGTVLPFKFGMLCAGEDAVKGLLVHVADAARELLAGFQDMDEWTLEMSLDADAVARAVDATDAQLLAYEQEAARLPAGRAYFVRRRRDRLAADLLESRLADLECHVYERIIDFGVRIAPPTERAGRGRGQAVTLARTPLLVSRRSFPQVEAQLALLETEHAGVRLRFALSGPLPPYSFVTALDSIGRHR